MKRHENSLARLIPMRRSATTTHVSRKANGEERSTRPSMRRTDSDLRRIVKTEELLFARLIFD